MNEYSVGDRISIDATVKLNGAVLPLAGATVKAGLVLTSLTGLAPVPVAVCSILDEPNGRINMVFESADTINLEPGPVLIEVQVTRGGAPETCDFVEILIRPSFVT